MVDRARASVAHWGPRPGGGRAKTVLLRPQGAVGTSALLEEVSYVELFDRRDFHDGFAGQLPLPG